MYTRSRTETYHLPLEVSTYRTQTPLYPGIGRPEPSEDQGNIRQGEPCRHNDKKYSL